MAKMMIQKDKQQNKQQDDTSQDKLQENRLQDRFKMIQMASSKRIMSFLDENDVFHALDLLHKTYQIIFNSVAKNQTQQAQELEQQGQTQEQSQTQTYIKFTLFDDVADLIQKKLQDVSIRDLEAHINIQCLFDILKTAAITGNSSTTQYVRKFMRGFGSYISSRRKVKEAYNKAVWGGIFSYLIWNGGYYASDEIVNERAALEYIKQSHLLAFDYYYGLLINGITDVIKEYFYNIFIKNVSIELNGGIRAQERAKYRLFLAIAAHAYAYYIAEKALLSTSAEERKSAKSIIEDKSVKESFYIFINRLSGRDELSSILSKSFASSIENFLYNYEVVSDDFSDDFYDNKDNYDKYINSNVSSGLAAHEFFLFFAGFIATHCYDEQKRISMLDNAFTVKLIRNYLSIEQEKDTIAMFIKFFDLIAERRQIMPSSSNNGYNYSYSKILAERLYHTLSNWLKDKEVDLAEEEQKAFELDISYADYLRALAEEQLKQDFGKFLEKNVKENILTREERTSNDEYILCRKVPTSMAHDEEFFNNIIISISSNTLSLIIYILKNSYNFKWKQFSGKDYLATLKDHNIKTLIGGETIINGINLTRNFEEWQQIKNEIDNYTTVYIPMAKVAIALKEHASLKFKYDYIVGEICSLTDEEIANDMVKENNVYQYKGDSLRFRSIEELNAYIKNSRKKITVSTKIRIENAKDDNEEFTGFIFS